MLGIIFQVTEVERSRPPRATCLPPCGNCYLAAVIVLIGSLSRSTSGVDVRIINSSYLFFLEIPFTDLKKLAAVNGFTVISACTTYIKYMLTRRAVQYMRKMKSPSSLLAAHSSTHGRRWANLHGE